MFLSQTLLASNGGRPGINSSSWALLYGYSQNINTQGHKPIGPSYKLLFGNRWENNVEINFFGRYASQKANINFSSTEGNINRTDLTGGIHFGYWLFSALNLHAGYAIHKNTSKVAGSYSNTQISTIKTNYNLSDLSVKGLLGGADLVLLQGSTFQLFTNYEYYHLNHSSAHDWEAMVGIRFYPGPSKGSTGSSGSFFSKFFEWAFKTDGK